MREKKQRSKQTLQKNREREERGRGSTIWTAMNYVRSHQNFDQIQLIWVDLCVCFVVRVIFAIIEYGKKTKKKKRKI